MDDTAALNLNELEERCKQNLSGHFAPTSWRFGQACEHVEFLFSQGGRGAEAKLLRAKVMIVILDTLQACVLPEQIDQLPEQLGRALRARIAARSH